MTSPLGTGKSLKKIYSVGMTATAWGSIRHRNDSKKGSSPTVPARDGKQSTARSNARAGMPTAPKIRQQKGRQQ